MNIQKNKRGITMNQYLENLNEETKKYFKILSPQFPEWLLEYINTPEMQRIHGTSLSLRIRTYKGI